ncbi:MAG: aldose 1-epimerase family protein [Oscillospiraceae bacterium]|nr:aldose 1-epimerase family protein [Oscillospiraceae bacterium]
MYTIQNEFLKVTVAAKGAELMSIIAADGTEYMWQGDPNYWADRAPNIFPSVGRLTGGKYRLDGNWYELGCHGFAWLSNFEIVKHEPTYLEMLLADSEETLAVYPRKFAFTIAYTLRGDTLDVLYKVENRDEKELPFGIGGHPGFRVPLAAGKKFEDYQLRFSEKCQPEKYLVTPQYLFSGETAPFSLKDDTCIPLEHSLFDEDAIVLRSAAREVTLEAQGDSHSVTVTYPGMRYIGFWHKPHSDAPYVCIEPWCSLASFEDVPAIFEERPDLLRLAPGKTYENLWSIRCRF